MRSAIHAGCATSVENESAFPVGRETSFSTVIRARLTSHSNSVKNRGPGLLLPAPIVTDPSGAGCALQIIPAPTVARSING